MRKERCPAFSRTQCYAANKTFWGKYGMSPTCTACMLPIMAVVMMLTGSVAAGGNQYKAAVYEHRTYQSFSKNASSVFDQNLLAFTKAAAAAQADGADIIVFPEDGIAGLVVSDIRLYAEAVPSLESIVTSHIVPCSDRSFSSMPILSALSCMALQNKIAVVANMPDQDPGTGDVYNTDVAFDTDGRLLMKYHKVHLFGGSFTPGSPTPSHAPVFTTSFGVTFGMCTCYDILFRGPCHDVVLRHGATELAFPTAWMNAGPLLYSVAVQQSFAAMMRVNVLAANTHLPEYDFTGSGIFTAQGTAAAVYLSNDDGPGRLLVADLVSASSLQSRSLSSLPREHASDPMSPVTVHKHPALNLPTVVVEPFTYIMLSPEESTAQICQNQFCCQLTYQLEAADGEYYALGAYNALKPEQPVKFWEQACTVVNCADSTTSSCAKSAAPMSTVQSRFRSLNVTSSGFDGSADETRVYPVAMTSDGGLLDFSSDVTFGQQSTSSSYSWYMSVNTAARITAAGLFAHPALPSQ